MTEKTDFDLRDFLPYLLNQAAEASSTAFQSHYKGKYGMLRTEWRVLFHLGRYGAMTSKEVCERSNIHKTKVSRAVSALEQKRYLKRTTWENDRRHETLSLTPQGERVFQDLRLVAMEFDARMAEQFTPAENDILRKCLTKIAAL